MPLDDVETAVDRIIERVGKRIVFGIPLGLGKPVELTNALYRRAQQDPSLQLKIFTALSLAKPSAAPGLERAFMQPFVERVFAGVPELDYVRDQHARRLPANVEICEFFFLTGAMLGNAEAQRDYISSNYTHAPRDVFNQGCNVVAQIVCRRDTADGPRYSMSCNPDTGPEVIRLLEQSGRPHLVIGVVNQSLPYFGHDAELPAERFDYLVEHPRYTTPLFSTPKMPVVSADYAIGLQVSALVRDGGTLQLGIGSLGDAIVHALQLRHGDNARYRRIVADFGTLERHGALVHEIGGLEPFAQGVYGATEMFVDGFWHLLRDGILRRRVYDFWALQQLVDEGRCDPQRLDPALLDAFDALGVRVIRTQDFEILQHHGFFNDATRYERGYLIAPDGTRVVANIGDPQARAVIGAQCLGAQLRHGIVLHGGFFLGPRDFYQALRDFDEDTRASICMTGVDKINQLDRNPRLYQLQRRHARFVNTGMMVTLSGNFVADGLDDGRIVSGVGGQYNFVAQAHQLDDGRSILMLRAVRENGGTPSSNVLFNYGHTTIPRHLRDLVVTEYGIADLRSQTDSAVAKALICIADSRFQDGLLAQAQKAGKIEAGWRVPEAFRRNTPEALDARLAAHRSATVFPPFPFGSDFDATERALLPALGRVRSRAATTPKWKLLMQLLRFDASAITPALQPYLERLQLTAPKTLQDRVARMLIVDALRERGLG
ncbi:acetyl-CoA hydrolase/transferase C-terminal domain-containing protein [Solimonas variicoloris]|uniref:acetyl-CoA hydrolase/transferase C-terminal domain-containing protein n=1 Tax=Solimonas variicoloris TaxID=254408 RepID=UPI001FE1F91F|nr:acetyl-CoA hydrolase/transferase C-terminal domain-containing protein [Solimonas variicoloris]